MTKYVIVAVRDRALDAFNRPYFAPTTGAAIRAFSDEINRGDSPMNPHAEDYDLFDLGTWDDETGQFHGEMRKQIAIGKDVLIKKGT